MSKLRSQLFEAMTGRSADVSGKAGGSVRGMLLAVGGASRRTKSGIDLTKAAKTLGVSRRTAERWVKTEDTGTGQRPSAQHSKTLAAKARQAATTKAGRRAALAGSSIRQAVAERGARVTIEGHQGPHLAGREYMRVRTTALDLSPEDAEAMMNAWEAGGEKGFMEWATFQWGRDDDDENGFPKGYLAGWTFGPVSEVEIKRPHGGEWR